MDTFREKFEKISEFDEEFIIENGEHAKIIFGDPLPTIKETETLLISEALDRADDNQSIAAKMLGLTRRALNNRLQRAKDE